MATATEFRRLLRQAETRISASDIDALAATLAGPAPDGALRYSEDDMRLVACYAESNLSQQGVGNRNLELPAVLMRFLLPDSPPAVQLPAAATILPAAAGWVQGLEMGGASADNMRNSAVPEIAARFAEALHRCDQLLAPLAAAQLHSLSLLLAHVPLGSLADDGVHRGLLAAAKSIAAAITVTPEGSLRSDPVSMFGLAPNWNAATVVGTLGKGLGMHTSCRWAAAETATLIARKVRELAATSDITLCIFDGQFGQAIMTCLLGAGFAAQCKSNAALPALDDIQQQVLSMVVGNTRMMGPSAPSVYYFLHSMAVNYGSATAASASASGSRRSRQRQLLHRHTDWVAKAAQAVTDVVAAAESHIGEPGSPASPCQGIAALLPCVAYLLKVNVDDLDWRHHRPAMAAAVAAAEKIMHVAVGLLMGAPPDFLSAPCPNAHDNIPQILHRGRKTPADTVGERLAVAAAIAGAVAHHAGFLHLTESEHSGIGQPGGDLSNDNVRAMTDALVADGALSTVLLWLQLPAQHLADFNRSAASQGRLYLHTGVTLVCNWLPLVMAAAMALVDSGQRPRPALLRLAFAGGAALTRVAALTLNGEAVLQPAGSGQREGVPAAHVGPVMLSAAMRHCMQLALPPPAPPIVQQAVAALTSFLPAAAAAGEATAALAAAGSLADVIVFAPSAPPLLAEGGPHAWRPVLLQEVRRRASDSVMAAIALHLELISALVAGAIQRHVPDAADVEAATAALAAMSVGAPPAAGPRRCSADQLD